MRYSGFRLLTEALRGNTGWKPAWRDPKPKPAYDVIIIGGGGHGLASAYYLAKEHGITDVAVLEKGWIGGGNVGRNTTVAFDQQSSTHSQTLPAVSKSPKSLCLNEPTGAVCLLSHWLPHPSQLALSLPILLPHG